MNYVQAKRFYETVRKNQDKFQSVDAKVFLEFGNCLFKIISDGEQNDARLDR